MVAIKRTHFLSTLRAADGSTLRRQLCNASRPGLRKTDEPRLVTCTSCQARLTRLGRALEQYAQALAFDPAGPSRWRSKKIEVY